MYQIFLYYTHWRNYKGHCCRQTLGASLSGRSWVISATIHPTTTPRITCVVWSIVRPALSPLTGRETLQVLHHVSFSDCNWVFFPRVSELLPQRKASSAKPKEKFCFCFPFYLCLSAIIILSFQALFLAFKSVLSSRSTFAWCLHWLNADLNQFSRMRRMQILNLNFHSVIESASRGALSACFPGFILPPSGAREHTEETKLGEQGAERGAE